MSQTLKPNQGKKKCFKLKSIKLALCLISTPSLNFQFKMWINDKICYNTEVQKLPTSTKRREKLMF